VDKILINSPYLVKSILINIYGFFLARKRFSGTFKRWFGIYIRNLEKKPARIRLEQFELLKKNVIYCYEQIPYYKRLFDDIKFDPYSIESVKDIQRIPFLTKDIIRKEFDNLYNKNIPSKNYSLHST